LLTGDIEEDLHECYAAYAAAAKRLNEMKAKGECSDCVDPNKDPARPVMFSVHFGSGEGVKARPDGTVDFKEWRSPGNRFDFGFVDPSTGHIFSANWAVRSGKGPPTVKEWDRKGWEDDRIAGGWEEAWCVTCTDDEYGNPNSIDPATGFRRPTKKKR
jgi:hypothetical protein